MNNFGATLELLMFVDAIQSFVIIFIFFVIKIPVDYTLAWMPVGYTRLELGISLKLTLSSEPCAGIF